MDEKARKLPQYTTALAAAGGGFVAGTLFGWTDPAQASIIEGALGVSVNNEQFSWISSHLALGAAVTCIPIGCVVNLIGHKITLLVLILPLVLGWELLLYTGDLPIMYVGRFMQGVAVAAFCVSIPLYTGEIAQKEIRGTLGAFFQLMITLGTLFVYVVGTVLHVMTMSFVCVIVPYIFFIVWIFMPESPVFWIKKGKMEDAQKSMKLLRGADYNIDSEISEIQTNETKINEEPVPFVSAMKRRTSMKAILIGMGLMFFRQLCGINAVIFYSDDIIKVSETKISPKRATIFIGVMQVVATIIATLIVDKVGRRILLLLSGSLMAVSTTALGVYFFIRAQDEESVKPYGWLLIANLSLFIIVFSIGYGPVPWIMMGELFASDIKGMAASLVATVNWVLAFVVTKTYPNIKDALGTGESFFIFSAFSLLGVFFVFFVVLETKGKSLNEIQQMLAAEEN